MLLSVTNCNILNRLIQYFQTLEQHPLQRMAILAGSLLFFWIIEGASPLLTFKYKKTKLRHAVLNFSFTLMHLVIHTFLAILIIKLSDWCLHHKFGWYTGYIQINLQQL